MFRHYLLIYHRLYNFMKIEEVETLIILYTSL